MPDAAQMAALHLAAAPDTMRPWSAAEFADLLAEPSSKAIITTEGFAIARLVLDEAELLMIATAPEHQQAGHGRRILTALETKLIKAGARTQFLEVAADNTAAIALYRRFNYTQVGLRKGYYARKTGPAVDAYVLQKTLA